MLDLKALVTKAKIQAAQPKEKRGSSRIAEVERQKQLKIGKFEQKRLQTLADIMRAIEEARKWEPQAVVLYVQRQTCSGCQTKATNVVGLFVRHKHAISQSQKMTPTNSAAGVDLYPREIREIEMQIPSCPVCFKAQNLVEMVFSGIADQPSKQLPLFTSLL